MKVIRDIRIDYQSTPALWMAYFEDYDGAPDTHPSGKLQGFGKTPHIALADLLEQEMEEA